MKDRLTQFSRGRFVALICAMIFISGCASTGPKVSKSTKPSESAWVEAHYAKREYRVAMRDGAKLHTAIYSPRDTSQTYPFLMYRTPYTCAPYGEDEYPSHLRPGKAMWEEGFIMVFQDVRGRFMSEGDFVNMTPHIDDKKTDRDVDESSDTYDTIEWLLENVANHNGRVGQWGISYPGFYTAAGMIDSHPALKASSPQAPIADWFFDDFHHHGAFFLPHTVGFFKSFGVARPELTKEWPERLEYGTPDGYQFYMDLGPLSNVNEKYYHDEIAFWNESIKHPNHDEFWQSRDILPHLNNVTSAVLTVGGWFDAEDLYGPLQIYRQVEKRNPDATNMIVMGPWSHGGWSRGKGDHLGNVHFGENWSEDYQANVELPFFRHYLKGEGGHGLPEALMFETGVNRWRRFDAWPPVEAQAETIHFQTGGGLSFDEMLSRRAYDQFESDPNKPVPFTEEVSTRMTRTYMTDDQRFAGRRPDVLVYQTEVLEEDMTLAGPIVANLWVSTTGTSADWVVKIIDVFPGDAEDNEYTRDGMHMGGYQMMVRSEVMRGRFRNSYEHPEPFVPNEPTNVRLPLQDVLHTFREGHRLMVQIQSTWFPLVDRNPQHYVDNIFFAVDADFQKSTHRVFCSGQHATTLEVQILPSDPDPRPDQDPDCDATADGESN